MQAGMLMGRSIFGGGALVASAIWGWPLVFAALIASIWLSMFVLLFIKEDIPAPETEIREPFMPKLAKAFARRETRLGLLFALTSAAAFEAVGALAGPFLIDRGASAETVGWFYGIAVVASTISGGILGGVISDRYSRTRSAGAFLIGFVAVILALTFVDAAGLDSGANSIRMILLAAMYLFVGLFTAASYALFMDITDPRIGGTQFSAYMSATNACESWSAWSAGRLVARSGYGSAFAAMSIVSLLSLFLLAELNRSGARSSAKVESS
jgi:predicted MFS family arabinose efflux permease